MKRNCVRMIQKGEKNDGAYPFTVAVGTSVWGVLGILFLGEEGYYCLF